MYVTSWLPQWLPGESPAGDTACAQGWRERPGVRECRRREHAARLLQAPDMQEVKDHFARSQYGHDLRKQRGAKGIRTPDLLHAI